MMYLQTFPASQARNRPASELYALVAERSRHYTELLKMFKDVPEELRAEVGRPWIALVFRSSRSVLKTAFLA
jgi:uncharacterized protein YcgL (UPF0745 family)